MPKIITNTTIDNQDARNLYEFFRVSSQRGEKVWPKGMHFTINEIEYVLGYTILERARKPGKVGLRYELISELLIGEGCYNTGVYQIAGTMALTQEQVSFSKISIINDHVVKATEIGTKTRLVKIQPLSKAITEENVMHEYQMFLQAGHLAVKHPTIYHKVSYTVMEAVNGVELLDVLHQDYTRKKRLTLQQRLELTKALLKALKEQVTDKRLVHRDIKPENIIVNLYSHPIAIKIIDFGRSDPIANPRENVGGTVVYAAPEIFRKAKCTEKTDVYSMGKILALIWGLEPAYYHLAEEELIIHYANNMRQLLRYLFDNIDDLSYPNRELIRSGLEEMLKPDPTQRWSVESAIEQFERVNLLDIKSIHHVRPSSSKSLFASISATIWSHLPFGSARREETEPVRSRVIDL